MLEKVKLALRITGTAYDNEISDLIDAATADLALVGVVVSHPETDALVSRAIITYCRVHFGSPDDFLRIKTSYDEQKAQLISARGYGLGDLDG